MMYASPFIIISFHYEFVHIYINKSHIASSVQNRYICKYTSIWNIYKDDKNLIISWNYSVILSKSKYKIFL